LVGGGKLFSELLVLNYYEKLMEKKKEKIVIIHFKNFLNNAAWKGSYLPMLVCGDNTPTVCVSSVYLEIVSDTKSCCTFKVKCHDFPTWALALSVNVCATIYGSKVQKKF
jgi:hypothetical protein